jgi:sarcosine oxidase
VSRRDLAPADTAVRQDVAVRDKVVVIGAGIMGVATAWALARDGHEVELLEQFEVGHKRGSSHGRTRIVRLAYPDPQWVELAREALDGWRELEREAGVELIHPCGGLLEIVSDSAQSSQTALTACGVECDLLDAAEAARRFPVAVPDGWSALLDPSAGIVRADLAHRAFLDGALAHGTRLHERTRVASVDDVDAEVVVVTAGAWVRDLVDVPVKPTRETVVYFRRDGPSLLPAVVQLHPGRRGHAMYALYDPVHGVKAGTHHAGASVHPDDDGEPEPELVERATEWVAQYLPDVDPEPVTAETCFYTTTADESFVLERRGRVVIGSACSGHGFKFAPVVGKRLARLATSGQVS